MDSSIPRPDLPMDTNRRQWVVMTAAAGGAGTVLTAVPFVSSFAPSGRAKAAGGPVEVDISDIPPGGLKTVEWRGKPVWRSRSGTARRPSVDSAGAPLFHAHNSGNLLIELVMPRCWSDFRTLACGSIKVGRGGAAVGAGARLGFTKQIWHLALPAATRRCRP